MSSVPHDIVFVRDLKAECVIGIYAWERRIRQTVLIDLDLAADNRRAAATDRIEDALNYKAVTKRVLEFAAASEFQLVETLAEGIAALLLEEFALPWVRVRVNKRGALRAAGDVGVVIERERR